jgi:hypothetical protein
MKNKLKMTGFVVAAVGVVAMLTTVSNGVFAQANEAATKQPPAKAATKPPVWKSPAQSGYLPLKSRPADDKAVVRALADAMGFVRGVGPFATTDSLNRLQWFGTGQVTGANGALVNADYSYVTSLSLGAAREDIKPKSGARIVRVVVGGKAWNETAPGIGGTWANDQAKARRLQWVRTPFGFTRAVLKAAQGSVKVNDPGPGGVVEISLDFEGVPTVARLDPDYRPTRITTRDGAEVIEVTYSGYLDMHGYGVMFPSRVSESVNGRKSADLKIVQGRAASYALFPEPASP